MVKQPDDIVIRVVRLSDAPSLRDNCLVMNTAEQVAARIQGYLDAHAAGECLPLVADSDGTVVGLAILQRRQHPLCRHRAELADMVVNGPYQGRGIARRLIEALQEHATLIGASVLETGARGGTPAEQVYRRVGFQEYGRLPSGIAETWGEHGVYDEVLFWMPAKRPAEEHPGTDVNNLVFLPVDKTGWQAFESWWHGNSELQRSYTPPTHEYHEYHEYLRTNANIFGRMVYEDGEPVALVQVDLGADGTGHVGLVVRPELWNRGYGRRILRALVVRPELSRLSHISANVHTDNVRSQRCFAGAGFVQQGDEPDKDGFLAFVYALARDEC